MSDESLIDALETLLERERQGLLAGDIAMVARLSGYKEDLVRQLSRAGMSPRTLARLGSAADRNASLLAAAARGLRSAMDRLHDLAQGTGALVTYDEAGRRLPLAEVSTTNIRRA